LRIKYKQIQQFSARGVALLAPLLLYSCSSFNVRTQQSRYPQISYLQKDARFQNQAYRSIMQILEYEMRDFPDLNQCEAIAAIALNRMLAVGINSTFDSWNPAGETQPYDFSGEGANSTCKQALNNIFDGNPLTYEGNFALTNYLTHFNHDVPMDGIRYGRAHTKVNEIPCNNFLDIYPSNGNHDTMFAGSCHDYRNPLLAELNLNNEQTTSLNSRQVPIQQTALTTCTVIYQNGYEAVNVRDDSSFEVVGMVLNGSTISINNAYRRDEYVWMANGVGHDGRGLSGWVWFGMLNCN
jgi:hypothetical protein